LISIRDQSFTVVPWIERDLVARDAGMSCEKRLAAVLSCLSLPFILSTAAGCAGHDAEPSAEGVAFVASSEPMRGAPAAPNGAAPNVEWPTPDGWHSESIPFPLFFAPELPHAGVAEVRFTPRCFVPSAETYFSYSFAFVLDARPDLSADLLAADLGVYYTGLARTFDAEHFEADAHQARLELTSDEHYRGVVNTVDPFNGSPPLSLNVEVATSMCGQRRVALFTVSPRPIEDSIWSLLEEQRSTLRCGS
jgi:hypothetical protein